MFGNLVSSRFAFQNGCPSGSFTMQCHCLGCGDFEIPKLVSAPRRINRYGMVCCMKKLDLKDQKINQIGRYVQGNICRAFRLGTWVTSDASLVETAEEICCYNFRTDSNDQLKVLVEKTDYKYKVQVKFASLRFSGRESDLVMSWGLCGSNSSLDGEYSANETPFKKESSGTLSVELNFDLSRPPFYISFLLKSKVNVDTKSSLSIRSHRNTHFVVPVGFGSGHPLPLGFSFSKDGHMNFTLFSRNAEGVILCLYDSLMAEKPALEIDLDPYVNKTGDIWHASIDGNSRYVRYGYRCKPGADDVEQYHVLLDPYAKVIGNLTSSTSTFLGELREEPPFDWGKEVRSCLAMEELVVYRLNVMRFTKDKSSKLANGIGGTFSGIAEKMQHFKNLGVNAILLEPIFPFTEKDGPYFPWHFFSPSGHYEAPENISSMKEMVKKLHNNGIEVFLEVVCTHTAENASLRVIDNSSYYHENAVNCNFPVVSQMILDILRYWVIEYHIDGFCFINASSLCQGSDGEVLSRPPLVEAIAFDPLLSKVKIIADSWDPKAMQTKEFTFPHWKKWAEVNSKFCMDVRNFLRGEGFLSDLATRLCGSGDAFLDGRGPAFSFNFIARNSGLSLVDLVSFSNSKNLSSEMSWNCGEEGPTDQVPVLKIRVKQIRNFLFILFMSLGVPILNMGDECGQSCGGSPAYADRVPFDWNALRTGFGSQTVQFISFLSELRKRRFDLLQRRDFLPEGRIEWLGSKGAPPKWSDTESKVLAMTLKSEDRDLYAAFNAAEEAETVVLPALEANMAWFRLVDTALPFPGFFSADGTLVEDDGLNIEIQAHSCALFEARLFPSS